MTIASELSLGSPSPDLDLVPSVTLAEAEALVAALAPDQSVLLLAPPGIGKSDIVRRAAAAAGLPCRSLLGTQLAPEDVSGIPRIVGERSVFCPPRVLLPEDDAPFCLFLDELPAASPDVQKALYSVLLERRLGEHALPAGSWVVAAGNRAEDNALVRTLSSALVNRVVVIHVRADVDAWLAWGREHGVRPEILSFVAHCPAALSRPPGEEGKPFSSPRAWTALSRALDRAHASDVRGAGIARALAFGLVSAEDASVFTFVDGDHDMCPAELVREPWLLSEHPGRRWMELNAIRFLVGRRRLDVTPAEVDAFLLALPSDHRSAVLVGLLDAWSDLGARDALSSYLEAAE